MTLTAGGEWRWPAQAGIKASVGKNEVPPYAEPYLKLAVAGVGYFLVLWDGVEVGGSQRAGGGDAGLARPLPQCGNQFCSLFVAFADHQVVKCLDPLCYLVRKLRLRGYSDFGFHKN